MPNSVKLKAYNEVNNEYVAAAAITPGQLVELDGNGEVQPHSSAGQNALAMIAVEDYLQGKGIDEDYAADDQVQCWVPTKGDEAYMILADGENVADGDFLESDGNGNLQKHEADSAGAVEYPASIVGVALEDKDLSASSGAESSALQGAQRIKIRIL